MYSFESTQQPKFKLLNPMRFYISKQSQYQTQNLNFPKILQNHNIKFKQEFKKKRGENNKILKS